MENYFWNAEKSSGNKVFVLIIYDIVDNKRRNAFAKMLNGYGFRVQKSAFEAMITDRLYKQLLSKIPQSIDPSEDSVRVYRIYGYGEVNMFGVNDKIQSDDVIIV